MNLELSAEQIGQRFGEKSSALAMVHVIANEQTLKEVATITSELNGAFLSMVAKRLPLSQLKEAYPSDSG